MQKIAVLADIHGNLPALEAVLADLQNRETPDAIWVLGDLVAFFPWVHEVIEYLMSFPRVSCLRGNTDRYLVTGQRHTINVRSQKEWDQFPQILTLRDESFRWMTRQLTYQDYCFLRDLPRQKEMDIARFGRIQAVHGVPGEDEVGLYPEMQEKDLKNILQGVKSRLLLAGHTHIPMDRSVDSIRIVNPGSVGMINGNQFTASYTILHFLGEECQIEQCAVPYDGEKVINKLRESSYPGAFGLLRRMEK